MSPSRRRVNSPVHRTTDSPINRSADFRQHCIVELADHTKTAGLVSVEKIGSQDFIRVDIPAAGDTKERTRYFGLSAIFALAPTDKGGVAGFFAPPAATQPTTGGLVK